ncbi:TPX2, C-terminal [Dillenia turbinata]|uniref:TPX2, C-terminal n=1 Tax=Dillenia turbinata TaxID=194707 RepID=A0AAN8ZA04_9MAGN
MEIIEKSGYKSLNLMKSSSLSAVTVGSNAREMTSPKPSTKENTKPQEIKLHTQERAAKRALFNHSVATKLYLIERQRKLEDKIQKIIEEEEIRMLRKEMIPRAQLMPLFDRPFFPQRSNRPLTIPREPSFHCMSSKCWGCTDMYNFPHCQAYNPF